MKKMKNKKIQESGTVSTPRILIINAMWSKGFSSYMTGVGSISSNNKNGSQSVGSSSEKSIFTNKGSPSGYDGVGNHSTRASSVT